MLAVLMVGAVAVVSSIAMVCAASMVRRAACAVERAALSPDSTGAHALCCAKAESTRGHNNVTRQLADELAGADPNAEVDPFGLVLGTELRPADILTSAPGQPPHSIGRRGCQSRRQRRGSGLHAEHGQAKA